MTDLGLAPLASFAIVVALIPLALWLLKRTPMGGAAQGQLMRSVAALPLSTSQRIVTVEVGSGDDRRWLVLGVTPNSISTLHTMAPQWDAAPAAAIAPAAFADLLTRLRGGSKDGRDAS
jgi:flagellar protein FliO/FliZ